VSVERRLVGAEGAAFDLTLIDRGLIAGRAIWFYLGKIIWPANLIFIYPRWHVSRADWLQYLYPAAAILVLGALWTARKRWRGPLAGALFFVGTLFPALGFFNVYPFLFSFVADHFQYLASLGVIALAAAGITRLLPRRPLRYGSSLAILSALAVLTWKQSHLYADVERLYRSTTPTDPHPQSRVCRGPPRPRGRTRPARANRRGVVPLPAGGRSQAGIRRSAQQPRERAGRERAPRRSDRALSQGVGDRAGLSRGAQ